MENEHIICGYHTLINWEHTDEEKVIALIEVKVTPQREMGFDKIAEKIMAFDEVETVNLIAGSYDLSLVVTGKTMNDVASFVSRRLSPLANVLSCQTNFILKNYKEGGVIMAETIEEEDKRSLVL